MKFAFFFTTDQAASAGQARSLANAAQLGLAACISEEPSSASEQVRGLDFDGAQAIPTEVEGWGQSRSKRTSEATCVRTERAKRQRARLTNAVRRGYAHFRGAASNE